MHISYLGHIFNCHKLNGQASLGVLQQWCSIVHNRAIKLLLFELMHIYISIFWQFMIQTGSQYDSIVLISRQIKW